MKIRELYNAITAFLVIDISNIERRNLFIEEKVQFYNTMSTITLSIVSGFTAPLLYITLFGNYFAIIYAFIYNMRFNTEYKLFSYAFTILTIIPSLIVQLFLYFIYFIKHKKINIDYKGEYLHSLLFNPLLNVDIAAAHVQSVNFYYYFREKNIEYIKSYGKHKKSITYKDVKGYLATAYFICTMIFIIFYTSFYYVKVY